jgi:hypothetical protein
MNRNACQPQGATVPLLTTSKCCLGDVLIFILASAVNKEASEEATLWERYCPNQCNHHDVSLSRKDGLGRHENGKVARLDENRRSYV